MNIPLKNKLIFILISGLLFAISSSLINHFFHDKSFSWGLFAFGTIFFGTFFGLSVFFILKKSTQIRMKKIQVELNENEIVRCVGSVVLFQGKEKLSGKLLLTNKRLIFKSDTKNNKFVETQLDLDEIKEVSSKNSAVLFHNRMSVLNKTGENFDFLVGIGDDWLTKINTPQKAERSLKV